MHSSRMRTDHPLTVLWRIPGGGQVPGQREVSGQVDWVWSDEGVWSEGVSGQRGSGQRGVGAWSEQRVGVWSVGV